jgi:hypothetical protein
MILVLGLLHVPLPEIDYHNVRHHDGAGEVCPHHDHLLRWHPSASQNEDLAILHWHWFLPRSDASDKGPGDESPGPFLHAHLPDFVEPHCADLLAIRPEPRSRCVEPSAPLASSLDRALGAAVVDPPAFLASTYSRSSRCAPTWHTLVLIGADQRWNC